MKSKLNPDTTAEEKFRNFERALGQVLSVSKEELERRLEAERIANADKPKRGPRPKVRS